MKDVGLSVVVLVLNEEGVIGSVIEEIVRAVDPLPLSYEIIVTDGGSTDSTGEIIEKMAAADGRIRLVRVPDSKCYGDSVRAGMRHCRGELICLIDGDGQLAPKDIARMIEEISGGADIVQGWRVHRRDPLIRLVVSKGYNLCLRLFLGIRFHDCNCTLKVFRRRIISEQFYESRVSMISPLIIGMALHNGHTVREMPITHLKRDGASRIFGGVKLFKQIPKIFYEIIEIKKITGGI